MKAISSEWTDSERLYLCVAIAERIRDGKLEFLDGAQTIIYLGLWSAYTLEINRKQIMTDAGIEYRGG